MAKQSSQRGVTGSSIADNLPVKVTTINGKSFVSGLLWEKLDRMRGFMAEARQIGRDLGMDIVAIRQLELTAQAGFAPHRAGASKGHYSMAVVLAERYGEDFVAALQVDDERYVFVACSEGVILPNCDLVLSREEAEAKVGTFAAQLRRVMGGGRDRNTSRSLRIIAPASFGIAGSEERSIATDLDPKQLKRHQQLKPLAFGLSVKERRQLSIAVVATCVIAAGGYYGWHAYTARQKATDQARQREESIAAAKRAAGIAQAPQAPTNVPKLPHPWLRQPPVPVFVLACSVQMGKLPPILAGWGLVQSECTSGHLTASYQRDPEGLATLTGLETALSNLLGFSPGLLPASDGNGASFGVAFTMPPYPATDVPAPPDAETMLSIRSYFQRAGINASFAKQQQPAARAGAQKGDTPAPVQDWATYTLAVRDMQYPPAMLRNLNPATTRITSITETFNPITTELSWSINGAVYVAQ